MLVPKLRPLGQLRPVGMTRIEVDQRQLRSGSKTFVNSTYVYVCFELLSGLCSCLKNQNFCARNMSTPPAQYPQNHGDKKGLNFTERDLRQFEEPYVDV